MKRQDPEAMERQRNAALRMLFNLSRSAVEGYYFTANDIRNAWLYWEHNGDLRSARKQGMVCPNDIPELFKDYMNNGLIKRVIAGPARGYRVDLSKKEEVEKILSIKEE